MKQKLPFIFGKSSDLINFTDREEECMRLAMNFKSLINTTIISAKTTRTLATPSPCCILSLWKQAKYAFGHFFKFGNAFLQIWRHDVFTKNQQSKVGEIYKKTL